MKEGAAINISGKYDYGNNNNKVDEMSPKQMENPFQDMNLKQDNIAVKRSLFDKIKFKGNSSKY